MKKIVFISLVLISTLLVTRYFFGTNNTEQLHTLKGITMGVIPYTVKYVGKKNVSEIEVNQLLSAVNTALSTYISESEVSQLNQIGTVNYSSEYLYPILTISKSIYKATGGAFDPTVGPLVNAWGFGPERHSNFPDQPSILDSLKSLVCFDSVIFNKKKASLPLGFQVDFSAIAKGFAVDIVSELVEKKGIDNYMVEIGGEVRTLGLNEKEKLWAIGIQHPQLDESEKNIERPLGIVDLKNLSVATSGNYRNYYKKDGQTFAHIIDPRTAKTVSHNLLSASVFSEKCVMADAFATAFMVLGLEKSIELIEKNSEIEAILAYTQNGLLKCYISDGIKDFTYHLLL